MKGKQKIDPQQRQHHVGAVLAAVAAVSAGIYLFGTKTGKKQRAQLQDWVLKAERDVVARLEGLGEVNKEAFEAIVDAVLVNYRKASRVDAKALADVRAELLEHWKGIEVQAKRGAKKAKGAAHRGAAKAKKLVRIARGR